MVNMGRGKYAGGSRASYESLNNNELFCVSFLTLLFLAFKWLFDFRDF